MRKSVMLFATTILCTAACSDDGGASAPVAPTNLAVANVSGGGHLTWTDNSDNEDAFMIMRKTTGAFGDVDMVPFNGNQYHDDSVAAGMTYIYKVVALNAAGESSSNEATFAP